MTLRRTVRFVLPDPPSRQGARVEPSSRSLARKPGWFWVVGLLFFIAGGRISAQAPKIELPQEVRTWLERDQVSRWAELLRTGEKKFAEGSCTKCHGDGGKAGRFGPDLTDAVWAQSKGDLEGIRDTIFWGVRRKDFVDESRPFEMNPTGGMELEWEEVDAVAAYVWSLSNGTFLPKRSG